VPECYGRAGSVTTKRLLPPGSRVRLFAWKICITYPVKDTGVKDKRLGVIADEWTFCFTFNNRLKRKFFWNS
jgi:hypothetical protein